MSMNPMLDMSVPPPMPPKLEHPSTVGSMTQLPMLQTQINMIKDQIQQSEKNLNAQKDVFKIKTKVKAFLLTITLIFNYLIQTDSNRGGIKVKKD